jgi:uncharacterized protein
MFTRPSYASIIRSRLTGRFRRRTLPDRRLRPAVFQSQDGTMLAGWYGAPAGTAATIILCHGVPGDKHDMAGLAVALMDAGFGVLAFDFRGWGDSDKTSITLGHREVEDVLAAVKYVQHQAETQLHIGIVGLSMGAAAAIVAAAQTPAIEAVVADSGYARLDQSVERATRRFLGPLGSLATRRVRRLGERLVGAPLASVAPIGAIAGISPRPVLIIHGKQDRLTDVGDAYALYRACGEPKALWIIDAAGHARTRRVGPEEYDRRVIGFFNRHLAMTA